MLNIESTKIINIIKKIIYNIVNNYNNHNNNNSNNILKGIPSKKKFLFFYECYIN